MDMEITAAVVGIWLVCALVTILITAGISRSCCGGFVIGTSLGLLGPFGLGIVLFYMLAFRRRHREVRIQLP